MKKIYLILIYTALLLWTGKASALNVTVTESGIYSVATRWSDLLTGMGHTVNVQPVTVLDNNAFFASTDVLIVSMAFSSLTATHVNTIQAFLQSGKPVYVQSEYQINYAGNQAFSQLVNNLGGTFTWSGTVTGQLTSTVHGTFATTTLPVSSLPYFWYGATGSGGSNIYAFLKSSVGNEAVGWSFCPSNSAYGKLITTTDQDWIQSSGSYTQAQNLMKNIFHHLITPNLCGPVGPEPYISASSNVSCNGGSNGSATVAVLYGQAPFTYSWAPSGGTGASISGRPAGTYTCTVTDAQNRTGSVSVTISQPAALSSTGKKTNASCSNGAAAVTVSGGTAPYTYSWSPSGGTGSVATNLAPGTYTCTYTDAKGCTGTRSFTIAQAPTLTAQVTSRTHPGCTGANNGSITVAASGGIAPLTYLWTPTGGTGTTASGLSAGVYTFKVTDSTGCTYQLKDTLSTPNFTLQPKDTVACNGGSTRFVATLPGSGVNYQWQVNNGSGSFVNVINNTTYSGATADTLRISNAVPAMSGYIYRCLAGTTCQDTSNTAVLTVKPTPVPVLGGLVHPNDCGTATGSIRISGLSNGTAYTVSYTRNGTPLASPLSLTASSGDTLTIGSLTAGSYSNITVTLNGCTGTYAGPVVLADPNLPLVTAPANATVCAGDTLFLSATSATGGVSYQWTGPNSYSATAQNPAIAATTTAMSGNYVVTAKLGNCISLPDTTVAVVNARPAAPGVSNVSYCKNATATALTATGSNLKWYTGASGGTAQAAAPVPTTTAAGTTSWYVSQTNANNCEGPRAKIDVTVYEIPAITLGNTANPTTCGGSQGRIVIQGLTAGAAYTVRYTRNGTAASPISFTAPASGNDTLSGLNAATYDSIKVTGPGGCVSNMLGPVTLANPAPPATPAPGSNSPVCATATLNLTTTAVTGATYAWTGPNSFSSSSQNPSISNVTSAAAGTYSLTVTVNNCTSAAGTVTIVVKPKPAAPTAGNNGPLCAGATLNLTATTVTNATYTWTGPSSYTASTQNPSRSAVTTAMAGTYSVIATVDGCASNAATTSVTINALPAAPAVNNIAYCQFEPSSALTATGTSLKWYTGASGGTALASAPVPATTTAGTFTWYVSQTNSSNCEGPRAAITVTVKPKPAPPTPLPAASYQLCQYSIASPLSATGQNLKWYSTNSGGTGAASFTPNTDTPKTFTVYATQTIDGCESDRLAISVTIKPKPAPPVVNNSPKVFCQYAPSEAMVAVGQNLLWYTVPAGGMGSQSTPVPPTNYVDTLIWYVSQTVNGCESDRAKAEAHIHYKPNGIITTTKDWVCSGDTLHFNYYGNATPAANYSWKNPMPQSSHVSGGGQGPFIVQFDAVGNQTIRLTVDNHGCLSPEITKVINVRSLPEMTVQADPQACLGDVVNVIFRQTTPGISGFNWNFAGGQEVYGSYPGGPFGIRWTTPGTYVVSVTGVANQCRSKLVTDTVEIRPLPLAQISHVSSSRICSGDSVVLRATETGDDYTYTWGPDAYIGKITGTEVLARPRFDGYIKLTVTDTFGCAAADSTFISAKPCCEVYFPNAFSPNNDGRNDLFRPIGNGHHTVSSFRVLNRWGRVVYESADLGKGWDGTHAGVAQDIGTYYYYIKYRCSNGKDYEQKGEIMLIR